MKAIFDAGLDSFISRDERRRRKYPKLFPRLGVNRRELILDPSDDINGGKNRTRSLSALLTSTTPIMARSPSLTSTTPDAIAGRSAKAYRITNEEAKQKDPNFPCEDFAILDVITLCVFGVTVSEPTFKSMGDLGNAKTLVNCQGNIKHFPDVIRRLGIMKIPGDVKLVCVYLVPYKTLEKVVW
eukprot:jgi/Bigna1/86961/estExt_fgenesh1_pg.C_150179